MTSDTGNTKSYLRVEIRNIIKAFRFLLLTPLRESNIMQYFGLKREMFGSAAYLQGLFFECRTFPNVIVFIKKIKIAYFSIVNIRKIPRTISYVNAISVAERKREEKEVHYLLECTPGDKN